MKVGVLGASGYAGAELLRLCAGHPDLDVTTAMASSNAGEAVARVYPSLAGAYPELTYQPTVPESLAETLQGLDLVFMALPHGESQHLVANLEGAVPVLIDLAADFRLIDPEMYHDWYGEEHTSPQLLGSFAYGLPELFRKDIAGSTRVAVAGCYPTAAALALAPLVRAGVIEDSGIVVDAASGVSGAGRSAADRMQFGTVDEDFAAYGLLNHRHTPEMEQAIGASVLFTPHLAPMVRGILASCYARPRAGAVPRSLSTESLLSILHDAYRDEPFVQVMDLPPSTKATSGSNCAHLTARFDERTGWVLVLCALDNLIKGAAGQAIQCANLTVGYPETTGLPLAGLYP